ncbi:MAG: hypothetical protein CK424_05115 [Legionella sp.]|nr:MAG: hypothetical protein CK424_05115 [Legionella sp.]
MQEFLENQIKIQLFLIDDLQRYIQFYEHVEKPSLHLNVFDTYVSTIEEVLEMQNNDSSAYHENLEQLWRRFCPAFSAQAIVPYDESQRSLHGSQQSPTTCHASLYHPQSSSLTISPSSNLASTPK